MNEIETTGLVLSVMPIGEYDRRIELLTGDMGRISAFARGARKPGSSLVSVTRIFAFGTFRLYQGKSSYTIQSAAIHHYFEELSADLDAAYYGFYFLELAQYFSRENAEASGMLKLLYYSLRALSLTSITRALVKSIYELKVLDLNGLCPATDRIAAGTGMFTFAKGAGAGCLRAYQYVLESPVEKLFTFRLTDEAEQEFCNLTHKLLLQSVDKTFQSLKLLEEL